MEVHLHTASNAESFRKGHSEALPSVDDSLGPLMEQLKRMGIHHKTLVI